MTCARKEGNCWGYCNCIVIHDLLVDYSFFEAVDADSIFGRSALKEGTKESARRAVVHFENQLEVSEANRLSPRVSPVQRAT